MKSFLERIATTYINEERNNLVDYCFVFPNKRSGVFFKYQMEKSAHNTILLPQITTITEFIYSLTDGVEASRMEQLFMLYNIYKGLSKEIGDFDKFQYWGEMLLTDFNDVDRYMVDASQLFTNIQHLKEIGSNYLTDDQIEIIRRFWGEEHNGDTVEHFWTHVPGNGSTDSISERFFKLWEILNGIYTKFKQQLRDNGLCYVGMAYRDAVDVLRMISPEQLPYKRYIFVGFNVLSTSEISIFSRLQQLNIADFYWDYNSPALRLPDNKASRFLSRYIKQFTSLYNIGEDAINTLPQINIIAVPSNIGQVKEVGHLLANMVNDGRVADPTNAIDTAVVLPDEELFIPLIDALPSTIGDVNITMGYPLRNTSIAAFITNVITMQLRAHETPNGFEFFHDDVLCVLSQPILRAISNETCDAISQYMLSYRLYNLPASVVPEQFSQFSAVFAPIKNQRSSASVFAYMERLLQFMSDAAGSSSFSTLDCQYLSRYRDALHDLQRLIEIYGISMENATFLHMLQRALNSESINFDGEPLQGLQIMGVLETRSLDFDNVIMLSMNERIFPRKHFARSFIPETLRRGYGLATLEFQESIFAYYFYRLIARARRVYLLFDARNSGLRSGEMSRYLYQLRYMFPIDNIKYYSGKYPGESLTRHRIQIYKTPEVIALLNRFMDSTSNKRLSASAINTYINCPLAFYMERVADIKIADPITDYIDESAFGSVVHRVVETIYNELANESGVKELTVTVSMLEALADDRARLDRHITRAVNEIYHHRAVADRDMSLEGEAKILGTTVMHMLRSLYRDEKQFAPFVFIAAEYKVVEPLDVMPGVDVNFSMTIDRIDKRNGNICLIDYKTGGDTLEFSSVDELFDASNEKRPKAIFQLMLYACAYSKYISYNGSIQPYIYQLKKLNINHLPPLMYQKAPFTDYLSLKDEFWHRFQQLIAELFNPDIPFEQTKNIHNCEYCKYAKICRG